VFWNRGPFFLISPHFSFSKVKVTLFSKREKVRTFSIST